MNAVAILEVSLLLAFIAICVSRPRYPLVAPARPAPPGGLTATLRVRRLDQGSTTEATPATVLIAPPHDEGAALQVLWVGNTMLADLEPADILTARAWSRGALVCGVGVVRREYGTWQPDPAAGWEMFVVTRSRRLLHLQGGSAAVDADLVRFTERLHAARIADVA